MSEQSEDILWRIVCIPRRERVRSTWYNIIRCYTSAFLAPDITTSPTRGLPPFKTVYLDVVSVGATINIMLAAALADGNTIIENAAI